MLRDLCIAAAAGIVLFLALMAFALYAGAAPSPADPLVQYIQREQPKWARPLAPTIVKRARIEARRRGLDYLALLAIAGVESGYNPRRTLARDGSRGIYQVIAGQSGPREARALLRGCHRRPGLARRHGEPCEAPEVALLRRANVRWTARELRDVTINTYIAAYEIQRHVVRCLAYRHKRYRAPRECPRWLVCYALYNSGYNPPRWYYLKRLCARYDALRKISPKNS